MLVASGEKVKIRYNDTMKKTKVIIVGGGFGGINCAKALANANVDVTLIDKTNHHLFQPLLYQVATSELSPGDIAVPLRSIFKHQGNTRIVLGEVSSVDQQDKKVVLSGGDTLNYDYLVLAPGARHSYFGKDDWEKSAPGLKTLKDALAIREKILIAFEHAERETDPLKQKQYMTFVVVGAGPTGVEMAGAIAEIAKVTLRLEFRNIDATKSRIVLVEAGERILHVYSPNLSQKAHRSLERLGVEIKTKSMVTDVQASGLRIGEEWIDSATVIWAAGNAASPLLKTLTVPLDRAGRAVVESDLSIPGDPHVFVIGDAAAIFDKKGQPLPGVAPVASQEGKFVAKIIKSDLSGLRKKETFWYWDRGTMATIGRFRAVAATFKMEFSGFFAWILWSFVHILFLIDFRSKVIVLFEWIWNLVTYKRSVRLIINLKIQD